MAGLSLARPGRISLEPVRAHEHRRLLAILAAAGLFLPRRSLAGGEPDLLGASATLAHRDCPTTRAATRLHVGMVGLAETRL